MSNGKKIDTQAPTNPWLRRSAAAERRDPRGSSGSESLSGSLVSGRHRVVRPAEPKPSPGESQRSADEYVNNGGISSYGIDLRATGLLSGRRRLEHPKPLDTGAPGLPLRDDQARPMRIPHTPPAGAVPPGDSHAMPSMPRTPSDEMTSVWEPDMASVVPPEVSPPARAEAPRIERPTADDLPGRLGRSGAAAAADPAPASLEPQDSWDRLMEVGPAADAQMGIAAGPPESIDTRSDMERLLDDRGVSFFDYVNGNVPSDHFAQLIKGIAELKYPHHTAAQAIDRLAREIGHELRPYIYTSHRSYDLPPRELLDILERSIDMAEYESERFREQYRFAQLSWDETIEKIEWERKSDRNLERMLRLIQLIRPGQYFRHRPKEIITSVKDHVRRGKGDYADVTTRFGQTIKGSYPLDSMTDWIAFGFLTNLPHVDVLQVVLNASWGGERLLVPLRTKRENYRIYEMLKEKGWKAADWLTPKEEGRALVNAAIEAEEQGEMKSVAVLYTLLAEMHYREREEAEGYYDFSKELIELRSRRPDTDDSSFEESFKRGRARVVQSLQRKAAQREALAFDSVADMEAQDHRKMIADILRQSPELIDMSVNTTTSTGLHNISSRDEQRIISLKKKGKGWVHPYREVRRFLYGIVAAHKWLSLSKSLMTRDPHDAFTSCQRAQEALDTTMLRFYILREYDSDELGVSLGKLIEPMNPLIGQIRTDIDIQKELINEATLAIARSMRLPPSGPPRQPPPPDSPDTPERPTAADTPRRNGAHGNGHVNSSGISRREQIDHAPFRLMDHIVAPARAWITGVNVFAGMPLSRPFAFGKL